MPFDDTDIKKMIKAQLQSKIKYPSKLDFLVKDLISIMLEPDVTRRATIEKISKHPWLKV